MFYKIENDKIISIESGEWEEAVYAIVVYSEDQWNKVPDIRKKFNLNHNHGKIHFCKLESYSDHLFGTYKMPVKKNYGRYVKFAFYILEGKIIFVDDGDSVNRIIQSMINDRIGKNYSFERFIYDFFMELINDDLLILENLEKSLSAIEEDILHGKFDKVNNRILPMKKEVLKLHRYYVELMQIGDELQENAMDIFNDNNIGIFRIFSDRTSRLLGETQVLRDYAVQVQGVYESEIGIRQNDIMKMLTIVTTIFLPLTLLAGWYGMNFIHMPELHWKFGYPFLVIVSILIVVFNLWYMKRKKFW